MNEYKKIMNKEIRKRMESDSWNFQIAAKVVERKRSAKNFRIYSASLSSLAAAALVMIIFFFTTNNVSESNPYDRFIASQLDGTYNYVFNKENSISSAYNNSASSLLTNDIDIMIDDMLSKR